MATQILLQMLQVPAQILSSAMDVTAFQGLRWCCMDLDLSIALYRLPCRCSWLLNKLAMTRNHAYNAPSHGIMSHPARAPRGHRLFWHGDAGARLKET